MAAYSNSTILSAVLNKWLQPVVTSLTSTQIQSLPFVSGIENKIKSMGWVGPNWSLTTELAPMIEPITGSLIEPMLKKQLSQLDDASIPAMAHSISDKMIEQGQLVLLEGKITFEAADLDDLKKLLNANLPLKEEEAGYVVKETEE